MKNLLLLLLFAITLTSCEKDDIGALYDDGLIKRIDNQGSNSHSIGEIVIKYDDLDRVYSINDTLFYYDEYDKVIYTRYNEHLDKDGYKSYKIIKKSYSWDAQNRLLAINVDSNYQLLTDMQGMLQVNSDKPYTEAYFYYSDNNTIPDSIGYNDDIGKDLLISKRLYHSNGNINKIEDIQNIGALDSDVGSSVIMKSIYLDYSDQDNYLYPLYRKLGFLPKSLGYVTSQKLLSTSEIVETIVLGNVSSSLQTKKTTVKNVFSSNKGPNGYPTLININSMIDFDNGMGYTNVGSSDTYIYY